MTIELAHVHTVAKPWGVSDVRPWANAAAHMGTIGEIWYERLRSIAPDPSLLLKLLFTSQPLSIQVHPNDSFAHSIDFPRGKTEAWYVLSAAPGAEVGLGLDQGLTPLQLREVIADGSIAELIVWRAVSADDVIFVPAGTIHAIGAGLVIAELQQRSDVTFRLFDYGRHRELHIDNAIAVANTGRAEFQVQPTRINDERTLLISNYHFVFERIHLAPNSTWRLDADRETWLLILKGSARAANFEVALGDAIFAQSDRVDIRAGSAGLVGLAAYTGPGPTPHLVEPLEKQSLAGVGPHHAAASSSSTRTKLAPTCGPLEITI